MSDIIKLAKKDFESLPTASLQARLAAWQARNFGAQTVETQALGVCEEVGELAEAVLQDAEAIRALIQSGAPQFVYIIAMAAAAGRLAHVTLKHVQKIRGMDDPETFRAAAGDAIADLAVFSQQYATLLRLDYMTLVNQTAEKVMKRDFKKNSKTGG